VRLRRSFFGFAVLIACLVGIKLLIQSAPGAFRSTSQAAVFAWPMILALALLGGLGVWLSDKIGLPGLWDERVPLRQRLFLPLLVGSGCGLLAILVDWKTGWAAALASALKVPSIHVPFPTSLPIYLGGAIIVDIIYYLVPIPLVVWLVSNVLLKGGHRTTVFWIVAVLAASVEPVTQDLIHPHFGAGTVALLVTSDLLENLAQVYFFWRAGFGAAVLVRVALYLFWHVLWPLI